MIFTRTNSGGAYSTHVQRRPNINSAPKIDEPKPENKNLYIWGKATWYFFHTIAHKIKPEHFLQKRKEILDLIMLICGKLPCPICADHARTYLNSINFNNIQTKQGLKRMLFDFHNNVNSNKNFDIMNINDLDALYDKGNTTNIFNYFLNNYIMKTNSIQYAHITMQHNMIIKHVRKWIDANRHFLND